MGTSSLVFNHKQLEMARSGFEFKYIVKEDTILFNFQGKEIRMRDADYNGDIVGVFYREEYKNLDVKNKTVIDIGASIGDTAIYFALKGARNVIAFEPYPKTFQSAMLNVQNNLIGNAVKIINGGYGPDLKIRVDPNRRAIGSTSLQSAKDDWQEIELFSLKTIANMFDLQNAVLKMDCEGCEYHLLNEDPETLNIFSQIQIEYHYGYKNLIEYLSEAGFDVDYTNPSRYYNKEAENPNMEIGMITARKSPGLSNAI
ncbi:MAG: FkbM family methyltransferase [Candidatus Micrarchaeia archaeon]